MIQAVNILCLLIAVICFIVAGLVPAKWNQGIAFGLAALIFTQLVVALVGV